MDYINASLVEVPAARRRYILTQGPLPNTTGHFWLLVWEQHTRAIIMLNKTIEKNQVSWDMGGWSLESDRGAGCLSMFRVGRVGWNGRVRDFRTIWAECISFVKVLVIVSFNFYSYFTSIYNDARRHHLPL